MLCSLLLSPSLALATDQSEQPAADRSIIDQSTAEKKRSPLAGGDSDSGADSGGPYIMQLVASLVMVLLAIAALAWLMKRLNRLPNRAVGQMRVLGGMALGARERAVLVQVGDTQMLLGVSPGRVTTLHVFTDPVVDPNDKTAPAGSNFASILSGLGKGRQGDRP